ncbi:MAG: hypothetical protein QM589_18545 [Thermomicrobiales bacterium]
MRRRLRNNGLALTLLAIFVAVFIGQSLVGWQVYNHDQREHGEVAVGYIAYVQTPSFMEVTFENWESEFLQMAAYILLTAWLFQKGSAESRDPDALEGNDGGASQPDGGASPDECPWPVRRGGFWLRLYENSLLIAFALLFAMSFVLHAIGGTGQYSQEQEAHGGMAVSTLQYLRSAQFWYESLQNWQSEFLAVFAIMVLTIFLRQKGSPESKPIDAPHHQTGA